MHKREKPIMPGFRKPNPANQDPLTQVLVWDRTQNGEREVLMNIFRGDSAYWSDDPLTFYTPSSLGQLEVHFGGWDYLPRPGVTRIFVMLRDSANIASVRTLNRNLPGIFQLNFKHFISYLVVYFN